MTGVLRTFISGGKKILGKKTADGDLGTTPRRVIADYGGGVLVPVGLPFFLLD